jgi:hypothetical protein
MASRGFDGGTATAPGSRVLQKHTDARLGRLQQQLRHSGTPRVQSLPGAPRLDAPSHRPLLQPLQRHNGLQRPRAAFCTSRLTSGQVRRVLRPLCRPSAVETVPHAGCRHQRRAAGGKDCTCGKPDLQSLPPQNRPVTGFRHGSAGTRQGPKLARLACTAAWSSRRFAYGVQHPPDLSPRGVLSGKQQAGKNRREIPAGTARSCAAVVRIIPGSHVPGGKARGWRGGHPCLPLAGPASPASVWKQPTHQCSSCFAPRVAASVLCRRARRQPGRAAGGQKAAGGNAMPFLNAHMGANNRCEWRFQYFPRAQGRLGPLAWSPAHRTRGMANRLAEQGRPSTYFYKHRLGSTVSGAAVSAHVHNVQHS